MADGDGRAVLTLAEEVWRAARPGETLDADAAGRGRAAARADLRQGAGRPLQSDLGLAQMRARLRSGRGALLSRAHVRRRRGPAVHRPARRAHGLRGHRPRRPAGARRRQRRQGRLRFPRQSRGRTRDRRGRGLCRDRAEIERGLQGVRRRAGARESAWLAGAAEDHPQRADAAHEARGLRRSLSNTTTTRPTPSAARTTGPTSSAATRSTSRSSAASSARSGSGSSIGRGCARSGAKGRG